MYFQNAVNVGVICSQQIYENSSIINRTCLYIAEQKG